MQQQGYADEQVNEAKAQIADLLTEMNDQTVACYDQFATMPQPVQYLGQICYASVPGWCCHARCYVPEWYYDNGCFVGPCFNAAYCGRLGRAGLQRLLQPRQPLLHDYHNVANTVHINRSINWRIATPTGCGITATGTTRWRTTGSCIVAHAGSRTPRPGFPQARRTMSPTATRRSATLMLLSPARGANRARTGNRKPVVHNRASKPHANRAPALIREGSAGRQPRHT